MTLLSFVICHLSNHSLALVSLKLANAAHAWLIGPWRTTGGTWLLVTAALTHYGNALWSVYIRRCLRLPAWQLWQLGLGLTIPVLLMMHVAGTRFSEELLATTPDYYSVLVRHWLLHPWQAWLQASMLLTLWTHACIGLHFWLRTKAWYDFWRRFLFTAALILPTLALSGYVAAGNQMRRDAMVTPGYAATVLSDANITPATASAIERIAEIGWSLHLALGTLPFAGRGLRRILQNRRRRPQLRHPSGRRFAITDGATVLEILQDHGVPHAAACGGRGRCTTCRVRITAGLDHLPPPGPIETKALSRLRLPANIRLACQIRPIADLSIMPLLPAHTAPTQAAKGSLAGAERSVAVVFIDLRGSTSLGEARLPYDLLFILNQFFEEMTRALTATGGHYSNFTGDGLMALYGLGDADTGQAVRDALKGAAEMLRRLEALNSHLAADLPNPLRMGIGIHAGNAIVGSMGPPDAQILSAIGDTVNTTARLESLSKDYDCPLILSHPAAILAGLHLPAEGLHEATVKGREKPIAFHALTAAPVVG